VSGVGEDTVSWDRSDSGHGASRVREFCSTAQD